MLKPNLDTAIDWQPLIDRLQYSDEKCLPFYPGDLKTDLLAHAGLINHAKGEQVYQLAVEISRLTTCCDPEIVYWFSQLVNLIDVHPCEVDSRNFMLIQ